MGFRNVFMIAGLLVVGTAMAQDCNIKCYTKAASRKEMRNTVKPIESAVDTMEKKISQMKKRFNKQLTKIKKEMDTYKEAMDARMLALSDSIDHTSDTCCQSSAPTSMTTPAPTSTPPAPTPPTPAPTTAPPITTSTTAPSTNAPTPLTTASTPPTPEPTSSTPPTPAPTVASCTEMWYSYQDADANALYRLSGVSTSCNQAVGPNGEPVTFCNGDSVVNQPTPLRFMDTNDDPGSISWVATAVETSPVITLLTVGVIELDDGDILFSGVSASEDWLTDIIHSAITGGVGAYAGASGTLTWAYIGGGAIKIEICMT